MIISEAITFYIKMILSFAFAFTLAIFLCIFRLSWALQDEAQFIAASQGKYGGYTIDADNALKEFVQDYKINPSDFNVTVSAPNNPVPWGTVVKADLTYSYKFKVGNFVELPSPIILTGKGRSTSTYLEGAYSGIRYTRPSF